MIVVHTHPEIFPDSRMETLRRIYQSCIFAIQTNQVNIRSVFPKPTSNNVRY